MNNIFLLQVLNISLMTAKTNIVLMYKMYHKCHLCTVWFNMVLTFL